MAEKGHKRRGSESNLRDEPSNKTARIGDKEEGQVSSSSQADSIFGSSGPSQDSQQEEEKAVSLTLSDEQKQQLQDIYQSTLVADTQHTKDQQAKPVSQSIPIPNSGIMILNNDSTKEKQSAVKKKITSEPIAESMVQEAVYRDRAAERRKQYNQPDKPSSVYPTSSTLHNKDAKEKKEKKDGNELDIDTANLTTTDGAGTTGVSFMLQSKYKGASLNRSLTSDTNNPGYQIMQKLGWKKGQGLGKGEQGIKAPLKAQDVRPNQANQRAGLGAVPQKRGGSPDPKKVQYGGGGNRAPKLDARSVKAYSSKKDMRELAQQRFNRLK